MDGNAAHGARRQQHMGCLSGGGTLGDVDFSARDLVGIVALFDRYDTAEPQEIGDRRCGRLGDKRFRRSQLLDHTGAHDSHLIGQGKGFALVVGDIDRGQAQIGDKLPDLGDHVFAQFPVEIGKRLVEQYQSRFGNDGAGNGDALLLAARYIADRTLSKSGQTNAVECGGNALFRSARPSPRISSGKDTLPKTVICGQSA